MNTLALQQRVLLEALWAPRPADGLKLLQEQGALAPGRPAQVLPGLQAYRGHAGALAGRALAAAYPSLAQWLGSEDFDALARRFWREHPPRCGDMAQWGAELAQFLAAQPGLLDEEPHLPDLARVEWDLHRAAFAEDAAADLPSLALLQQSPQRATLRLSPGWSCVASALPVASLAMHLRRGAADPGAVLRTGGPEVAVIWRQGCRPQVRPAQLGEPEFLAALRQGQPADAAVACAQELDFESWLRLGVQSGLVLGASCSPA